MTVIVVGCGGCGGHRSASLQETKSGIQHSDTNVSFFQPSISPREMSEAKINMAVAKTISGESESSKEITRDKIVVINQEDESFYFHHPERSQVVRVTGNDARFFLVHDIPDHIYGKFGGQEYVDKIRFHKKKKYYDGVLIAGGVRVNR